MLKTTSYLIAIAFATLLAAPTFAQVKYLGPSGGVANGSAGTLGFNQLCQLTFDGSQFSTSSDIVRSGSSPSTPSVSQWMFPTLIDVPLRADDNPIFTDISGRQELNGGALSCLGWASSSVGNNGLVIDGTVVDFQAVEQSAAAQQCVYCICDGMPFRACCANSTPKCECQPPGYSC